MVWLWMTLMNWIDNLYLANSRQLTHCLSSRLTVPRKYSGNLACLDVSAYRFGLDGCVLTGHVWIALHPTSTMDDDWRKAHNGYTDVCQILGHSFGDYPFLVSRRVDLCRYGDSK